jgi:tRNA nucleotidyltransferase (CCA-adding enzyme)
LESHDLDIAIDSMTGYEFAQQLANYQQSIGQSVKSIAKIASNPERSKHLETATSVVLGLSLDFVHLRCEEYQENSRIPNNVVSNYSII